MHATFAPERRALVPLASGAVVAILAVTATIASDDGPVLCIFRRCTGGYCPACGATRASASLLRADVAASWVHNPMVILISFQLGFAALGSVFIAGFRQRLATVTGRILAGNAALAVLVWIVRLSTGSIPIPFG